MNKAFNQCSMPRGWSYNYSNDSFGNRQMIHVYQKIAFIKQTESLAIHLHITGLTT
ncbi:MULTISPECIES: hypothetical protein [unclassified Neochlamydia]|uniref:hypothetical protein n=1 Tax=unclassified Neochlamydia TaxID=2643326 RepID=UPI00140D3BF5|nr:MULTISPECIES: hypothetical protein [unclassified Neochlamydia]MBS4165886.1 hypothetical protein [Neochlamydia sp. AcF65]MBS4170530.1 hypothetical protein [Neochlamydia sp. AcF95]NGY96077.1 hypothetical protein [Neochlamydia sp. AcF84]